MPDQQKPVQNVELNPWQSILVLILVIGIPVGYDVWQVEAGVISTFDDELWHRGLIYIVAVLAFLIVCKPRTLLSILHAVLPFMGKKAQ